MLAYARAVSEPLPSAFGDYLLLEKLGQGVSAEVFLAEPLDAESRIPSPLVIKRLHAGHAREERFVQRFRHEAQIAVQVDSAHVAQVYDVGSVGDRLYLAMEHIDGRSLAELLVRARERGVRIPVEAAVELVAQALLGLSALHELCDQKTGEPLRFAHRDAAPKNLMVSREGLLQVIDLGLGRSEAQSWQTRAGAVLGSLGYMSPEQVTGRTADHRTDLYTAGIILFELLAGRPLIESDGDREMMKASLRPEVPSIAALRGDVPLEIDAILRRALAKKVEDRFASAVAFKEALDRIVPPKTREGASKQLYRQLFPDAPAIQVAEPRPSQLPTVAAALKIPKAPSEVFARAAVIRSPPMAVRTAVPTTRSKAVTAVALLLLGLLLGVVARLAWSVFR